MLKAGKCTNLHQSLKKTCAQSREVYQPAGKSEENLCSKPGLLSGKWTLVPTCSKVGAVLGEVQAGAGTGPTAGHGAAVGAATLQLSPLLGR